MLINTSKTNTTVALEEYVHKKRSRGIVLGFERYVRSVCRQIINIHYYIIASRIAAHKLKLEALACNDNVECIVNLAFNYKFKHMGRIIDIKPMQIYSEILEFSKIVYRVKPKYILEIRTANGGTLFILSRLASRNATIISIDLPGGAFGGGYAFWRTPLYKAFKKSKQKLYLLRTNSHSREAVEKIKNILGGNKLDLIFIDGDHSYEGVKMDYEMYTPLVKPGGIIALHDIVPGPENRVGRVPLFWRELKKKLPRKQVCQVCRDSEGLGAGRLWYRSSFQVGCEFG